MTDSQKFTAQNALDLIIANKPPLNFGSGTGVYRAAVKRLLKNPLPSLSTGDLTFIVLDLGFVDFLRDELEKLPVLSAKERKSRADWIRRLRVIVRRLEHRPIARTTDAWEAFMSNVRTVAKTKGWSEHDLIPVTSSLRNTAVEGGVEPCQMTNAWFNTVLPIVGKKRRESLKRAARILDKLWDDIPAQHRPIETLEPVHIPSEKRKSLPLPHAINKQLEEWIDARVQGEVLQGLVKNVKIAAGIKRDQSTNGYRQAVRWMFDCLFHTGRLSYDANMELRDLARLDFLSQVAAEALSHLEGESDLSTFPWKPISRTTIYSRITLLIAIFSSINPDFCHQTVKSIDKNDVVVRIIDAGGLRRKFAVRNQMTPEHKNFCRMIVRDAPRRATLLNMHLICWAEAERHWAEFDKQNRTEKSYTINICVLAAILAIVVEVPFRSITVCQMELFGEAPDLSLPRGSKTIEFHVSHKKMKASNAYDASLKDTHTRRSRQILEWFISGPRRELISNRAILQNPNPNLLFGGFDERRYNKVLASWTEEVGFRMTTHLFRHATASILVNCCGAELSEVAELLGNTVAVVESNYLFLDLIAKRSKAISMIDEERKKLDGVQHPKWRAFH